MKSEAFPVLNGDEWKIINPVGDMRGGLIPQENLEQLHRRYLRLTEKLIQEIAGNENNNSLKHDTIVFLDKSARPVSWLMRDLWPHIATYTDENNQIVSKSMPEIKFVNIDRNHYRDSELELQAGGTYTIPEGRLEILRNIFSKNKPDGVEDWYKHNEGDNYFDSKDVLIVDEVIDSGDTLHIALDMFRQAFPEARFKGYTWMIPKMTIAPDGNKIIQEAPSWYDATTQMGRGVLDPLHDKNYPETELLSSTNYIKDKDIGLTRGHDEKTLQLRKELKALAGEYIQEHQ